MIYFGKAFYVSLLHANDALNLNKLLVTNTELFKRYLPKTIAVNKTLQDTQLYIADRTKSIQNKKDFTFTLKDCCTNAIAGLIILKDINWEEQKAEFAYCLGQQFQGRGWMGEAVTAVSNHAFNVLDLKTLQIIIHKSNQKSIGVAENSGFLWKKTLKNEFTPINESPLDMELYELTA